MSDEFDPYRKWLGIPTDEQPPNFYRLLGIAKFEDDPDVISNAADRQMSHVRTYQSSKHSDLSQQILNELSKAKVCLLSPDKREAYDAELKAQNDGSTPVLVAKRLPSPAAVPTPPPPMPTDEPVATGILVAPPSAPPLSPVEPNPVSVSNPSPTIRTSSKSTASRIRSRRKSSPKLIIVAIGGFIIAILILILVLSGLNDQDRSRPSSGQTTTSESPTTRPWQRPSNRPFPRPREQRIESIRLAIEETRNALAQRRYEQAAKKLEQAARLRPKGALAVELDHLSGLVAYYSSFWRAVNEGVVRSNPYAEYETRVRRISEARESPPDQVLGWAKRGLPEDDPFLEIYFATFLLFEGELDQAREYWHRAAAKGTKNTALAKELKINY